MKEIAILTLPLNNYNYGGILQAFALQTYLKEIFRVNVHHVDRQYNLSASVRMKMKVHNLLNPTLVKGQKAYYEPMIRFIKENIELSKPICSPKALERHLRYNKVDMLVTGSDQVWRKKYAFNIANDLFLDIPYNCKKISYAASFGTEEEKEDGIENRLMHLDAVSVREKAAQEYLKSLGIQAFHHIDPTLLLDKKIYGELADKSKKEYTGAVAAYVLDRNDQVVANIKGFARSKGIPLNFVGEKINITSQNCKNITTAVDSIEDWLKAFRDADYIVTDSFHGCVFSILFNKQFITLGNVDRGLSRFLSLLEMFGLHERLITSFEGLDKLFLPIDYISVNHLLDNCRIQALDYFNTIN